MFNFLKQKLQYADPGLIQTRKAIKSTLSLLVAIIVLSPWVPNIAVIFAGVVAMFLPLCTAGNTIKARIKSQLIATVGFFIALTLGWLLYPDHWLATLVLILMTFVAFYLRRWGERYLLFPPVATVVYLLAISFPLGSTHNSMLASLAILIVGGISIIILLLLWPNQTPLLSIRHQMSRIFAGIDSILRQFRVAVQQDSVPKVYRQQLRMLVKVREDLTAVFNSFGTFKTQYYDTDWLEAFWVKQFAFVKALAMVWESLLQLSKNDRHYWNLVLLLQELQSIQSEMQAIRDIYCQVLVHQYTPKVTEAYPIVGDLKACQNVKTRIYLLNLSFGLKSCQGLLQELHQMLASDQRWIRL